MDRIEIPEDKTVALEHVADGVKGLRIIFVNVFSIEHSDGSWTLIDCGLPYCENRIRTWVEQNFNTPPNAILLSHGHFDHVGAAISLANHWRVPVYAHPLEAPYLTGKKEYPPPNISAGGGVMPILSPLFPRAPIDLGEHFRPLEVGVEGALHSRELPGWKIIHTPGHTMGHVSLFREQDRVLLPADAFCTTKPESFFEAAIAQQAELHGPPSYFTSDWDAARKSVQALAALDPLVIAPGHGRPLSGQSVPTSLKQLASQFDEVAVPDNRKPAA
jgi:glyoxylase-like metal-dependent hydrolase (beta-lactamase superfamily II)